METRSERSRELTTLQQQVQSNQEQAEFISRQRQEMTAGSNKVERDAVLVVDKQNARAGTVRLNYLVSGATGARSTSCAQGTREKEPVQVEYLAAIIQQTGED